MQIKIKKFIFFTILVNCVIFAALEWFSGKLIANNNIYRIVGLMEKDHPLMEYDENLGYRIRKAAMSTETKSFPIVFYTNIKDEPNQVLKQFIPTKRRSIKWLLW